MCFFSLSLSRFLHFCSPVAVHPQNDVLDKLNLLWKFVKPISFALIGKEVLFSKLDAQLVGYGVLIVIIGSSVSHFGSIAKSFYFIDLLNTGHSNWLYIFEVIFRNHQRFNIASGAIQVSLLLEDVSFHSSGNQLAVLILNGQRNL